MTRTAPLLSFVLISLLVFPLIALPGCQNRQYQPDRATRPFPHHLHSTNTADIQVFRDGTNIELVNATATSYDDFDLWINQRYVKRIETLPAGERRRFSLWQFYDERGEVMNAGGFFRQYEPDPVRMVQMQFSEEQPLIGLITIRTDPLEERERILR